MIKFISEDAGERVEIVLDGNEQTASEVTEAYTRFLIAMTYSPYTVVKALKECTTDFTERFTCNFLLIKKEEENEEN